MAGVLLVTLPGCGWKLAQSVSASQPMRICIPYAAGDSTGEFTTQLISAVSRQPGFIIDENSQYQLSVKFLDSKEQRIGYRYDPRELHRGRQKIVPNENRDKQLVELSIVDSVTQKIVCGPAYILGSAEYDHQENSINNDINDLSLGQLSDINAEKDVTYIPLYRDLVLKIGSWLQNQQDLVAKDH